MSKVVLLGATGYTGRLTLAALLQRGLRPIIAGRCVTKLGNLSAEHGGLETRRVDIREPDSLDALLAPGDVLVTTVGPFMQYGETALRAAIRRGAHYVDSTGEPLFIRHVVDTYHQAGVDAKICLLPASAYDYVPGLCAAAVAIERATPAQVQRVDVGYYAVGQGPVRLSQGTKESILHIVTDTGYAWRKHRLVEQYGATKIKHFHIKGKLRPALSVATSESLFLPSSYPGLDDINVFLGWFGVGSYLIKPVAHINSYLFQSSTVKSLFRYCQAKLFTSNSDGPDAETRKLNPSQIIAQTFSADGQQLSSCLLEGANGYSFSGAMLAWTADQLQQNNYNAVGAVGQLQAFGTQSLLRGCQESGLEIKDLSDAGNQTIPWGSAAQRSYR